MLTQWLIEGTVKFIFSVDSNIYATIFPKNVSIPIILYLSALAGRDLVGQY